MKRAIPSAYEQFQNALDNLSEQIVGVYSLHQYAHRLSLSAMEAILSATNYHCHPIADTAIVYCQGVSGKGLRGYQGEEGSRTITGTGCCSQ